MKEIDMAEAKLNAITTVEQEDFFTIDQVSASVDKGQYVAEYINKHSFSQIPSVDPILHIHSGMNYNENMPQPMEAQNRHNTDKTDPPFKWNLSAKEYYPPNTSNPPAHSEASFPKSRNEPRPNNEHYMSELSTLARCFAEQVTLGRIPQPEPTVFYGDVLQYPQWKASFNTLIECKNIPKSERIYYLQKYLGGLAKEAVEGYFLINTDNAYDEAKRVLEKRYGDQFAVANAFRQKLDKYPKIAARDSQALRHFSDLLRQCEAAMSTVESLRVLDDCRENRKLLTKLPEWITLRWARIVAERKDITGKFPPFSDFVKFISKESDIACDPVTSLQAIKSASKAASPERQQIRHTPRERRAGSATALSTDTSVPPSDSATKTLQLPVKCSFCEKKHHIDDCRAFLAKDLQYRKNFAKEKGLCFGCFNQGHVSKSCPQRRTCKTCGRRHPTSLHGDGIPKERETKTKPGINALNTSTDVKSYNGVSLLNDTGESSKCSMILPVWMSHRDRPDVETLVYALLDTQSDTTFVLNNVSERLALRGKPVKLKLSTMTAKDQLIHSHRIDGLQVRGYDSPITIPLPRTYTREIMPANRSHIPTPEVARKWPHLRKIADNIIPLQDAEIGILIGYNCSRALTPREIIPSINNEPYGQRTDLGWGIVGIVNPSADDSDPIGTSHRILTYPVPLDQTPSDTNEIWTPRNVFMSSKTTVRETVTPREVTQMMDLDFSERLTDVRSLSTDDKQFLHIVEAGIRLTDNHHYEMPLPFKNLDVQLPNNRDMALRRLHQLKGRFNRDQRYQSHYVAFMNEIINNGYAERVPYKELNNANGHTWYIPHHGVYHSKKPDKLRVVFDCSARYQGISINDYLLQGPDLTNTLVGVLSRFRKRVPCIVSTLSWIKMGYYGSEADLNTATTPMT